MTKLHAWLAAALLGLATPLATGAAHAQGQAQEAGVPQALRGAWYAGDCGDPAAMLVLTGRAAAQIDAEAPARLLRFRELRTVSGWTLGTAVGAEAPRLLLRSAAEGLETLEPDAKLRDDRLPGDASPAIWRRCPATPPALAALHGEGVAFLAALEHLEAACATGAPGACATAIVEQGDVSGDGKLSPAELARLVRGAAWVLAAQEGATQDVLLGAVGAGTLGGLLAGRLLVESMDYDGDGRLSAAELGQDAAAFARATGTAAGQPLRTQGLTEGAGMLRALIDGLMNSR
jgi:hypothetical protein